jgi:two-component system cell cycle sensor histidine kinase/response regulator CckA
MQDFFARLFSSDFMPHGYCYLWNPVVLWLHAISDSIITLAYYLIPPVLLYFVRRRKDLPFHWLFVMFCIFIFGCGTTHLMEVWTLWHGTYRLAGVFKAVTALASISTAAALVPLVPRALALPSPSQLRAVNRELEDEIAERRRVEGDLQRAHDHLEARVQERTAELALSHRQLEIEIGERRSAEESLRKQADLLELVRDAIVVLDMSERITYWNAGAEEIYGWSRQQALGRTARELLGSEYPHGAENPKAAVIDHGRWAGEVHQTRRDGRELVVSSRWALQRDDDETPIAMLQINCDITAIKRAQEQQLVKQKLESVGTLASGIAHDFNNLLGGVLAQSEAGLAQLASGTSPEEELQNVRRAAIRGAEIVQQLMIYTGQENQVFERVDVSEIVEHMLELLSLSVSKHAVVETDLGNGLPAVEANAGQLRQVVMNLVTNASEAIGGRDGTIRVKTGRVTLGQASSASTTESLVKGDYVQLEVSDTGRGMNADTRARIFDPFFTTKPLGHGLGLAVVEGIVRSLGGEIRVVSALGEGTKVQILLPAVGSMGQPSRVTIPSAEEEGRQPRQATVLVVEDEGELRNAVSKLLRKKGFSVIEAGDGSAAMELIGAHKDKIDAILLDVTLPGIASRDVFAEAMRLRPELKVILTSAYSSEVVSALFAGLRVEHFIRKPFQFANLLKSLQDVLSS